LSRQLPCSRIVGSDLRAWHRLWTDDGQTRRVGSYQEVGTDRSTFRCRFAMGKIRGTPCMWRHISAHGATTKCFSNSFVFKSKIEKEGLPGDSPAGLGAGSPRFKSGRPDQKYLACILLLIESVVHLKPHLWNSGRQQVWIRKSFNLRDFAAH